MMKIYDFRKKYDSGIINKVKNRAKLENLDVIKTVNDIINSVKKYGDNALFEFTLKFDGCIVDENSIKVSNNEIVEAYKKVDQKFIKAIQRAIRNITEYHENQKQRSWIDYKNGIIYGQKVRPLEKVGVYVPGGTAAYPSSVLMNSIPAKVAGVSDIVMATPPYKGSINPFVIVAANEVGVNAIYKVGGAQAIAALAFGTKSIPEVDKIVGPGNIYVAMAKRALYGLTGIDMIAGPSEVLVIADENANPAYVVSDLLSQAEHDALASSILLTTSEKLATIVSSEINMQIKHLDRKDIISKSLKEYGAIIIMNSINDAIDMANQIAPEHLELQIDSPFEVIDKIKNAGAVFLGENSTEPIGDYIAGPNHVLPTCGTARFFSPLSVDDFIKKMSILYYSNNSLNSVSDDVITLAEAEGLGAHANAIRVRCKW